jgi:hypothetical protein
VGIRHLQHYARRVAREDPTLTLPLQRGGNLRRGAILNAQPSSSNPKSEIRNPKLPRRLQYLALLFPLLLTARVAAQTGVPPRQPSQSPGGTVVRPDSAFVPGRIGDAPQQSRRDSLFGRPRFRGDVRIDSLELVYLLDSLDNTPQARMRRNLAMSPSDWMPTRGERAAREADLRRAMDLDYLFPNSYIPLFGISTGAVFRALGLVEDVTPRITYTLMRTEPVTVKIYTMEAELVTTIVDAPQRPGAYDFEWDLKDADGVRVPYGNYIAEVIVGGRMVLRKRIEAP